MPDTAGKALGPGPGPGASATGTGLVRRRRRRWLRATALGAAVLVAAAAGTGWALYAKLSANITADDAAARELARYERERPTELVRGAQNILLIGSDTRAGEGNSAYGPDLGRGTPRTGRIWAASGRTPRSCCIWPPTGAAPPPCRCRGI